jgi:hypothetical protein
MYIQKVPNKQKISKKTNCFLLVNTEPNQDPNLYL